MKNMFMLCLGMVVGFGTGVGWMYVYAPHAQARETAPQTARATEPKPFVVSRPTTKNEPLDDIFQASRDAKKTAEPQPETVILNMQGSIEDFVVNPDQYNGKLIGISINHDLKPVATAKYVEYRFPNGTLAFSKKLKESDVGIITGICTVKGTRIMIE